MALELSLHICQTTNCKQLKISDTTGSYNVNTNPGGWGAPNPLPEYPGNDVVDASLAITAPDGSVYTFTLTELGLSSFLFPDPTGTQEMLFAYNGGIVLSSTTSDSFPDGFYSVLYTVIYTDKASNVTIFTNQSILLTCQTRCCVDKMFHMASQQVDCPGCDSNILNNALEAEAFMKSAEYAAACGKIEMAKKNLAKAQWICNTKNCSNC